MTQALHQMHGQAKTARSGLLPNFSADVADTEETFNLRSIGFNFTFPGFALPNGGWTLQCLGCTRAIVAEHCRFYGD